MTSQTTIFPLELKQESEDGTFEGYGAIFGNVDRDGDIVERGAFDASLKKRTPALLWQHDQKQPIGRFEIVREDEKGLYVKARIAVKGDGERVHELLKMGALNGLSIGFVAKRASRSATTGVRTIHEADLMEVSLVTFPANEMARIENVKSRQQDTTMPHTPRSFETLLRDNGFSRTQAKAITAKGFKAAGFGASEETEIANMIREVKNRTLVLEGKGAVEKFDLWAAPQFYGGWHRLRTVVGPENGASAFEMKFESISDVQGPFEIEVRYGNYKKKLLSPSSAKFPIEANTWQEPEVRAKSLSITGQIIRVVKS